MVVFTNQQPCRLCIQGFWVKPTCSYTPYTGLRRTPRRRICWGNFFFPQSLRTTAQSDPRGADCSLDWYGIYYCKTSQHCAFFAWNRHCMNWFSFVVIRRAVSYQISTSSFPIEIALSVCSHLNYYILCKNQKSGIISPTSGFLFLKIKEIQFQIHQTRTGNFVWDF